MTDFTIRDVGGVVHRLSLSTDPRYPVAMDALPRNLSRRRLGRDQEEGTGDPDAPLTPEDAMSIVTGLLSAFEGSDRDEFARHICDIAQSISSGNGDAAAFSIAKPAVRAQDRRPPAMDSRNRLAKRDPRLWAMMSRIKTHGY
jgi:hypothetical protein